MSGLISFGPTYAEPSAYKSGFSLVNKLTKIVVNAVAKNNAGFKNNIIQNPFVPFLSQLCTDDGSFIKINDITTKAITMVTHIHIVLSFLEKNNAKRIGMKGSRTKMKVKILVDRGSDKTASNRSLKLISTTRGIGVSRP